MSLESSGLGTFDVSWPKRVDDDNSDTTTPEELVGRKIVVVGAGSGIGAAVAEHFHDRRDHVLAVDVRMRETPQTIRASASRSAAGTSR